VGEGREGATIDHMDCKDNNAFTEGVLHWWKVHGSKFPAWAEAARIGFALTPNSVVAERVFFMLKAMIGIRRLPRWRTTSRLPSCSAPTSAKLVEQRGARAARRWSVVRACACGDCGLTVRGAAGRARVGRDLCGGAVQSALRTDLRTGYHRSYHK
jgi:hypothetical protein